MRSEQDVPRAKAELLTPGQVGTTRKERQSWLRPHLVLLNMVNKVNKSDVSYISRLL